METTVTTTPVKGVLRIFDPRRNLGRIRLYDGRETGILRLPDCMEDGDIAEARFRDDEPEQPLHALTAISNDWHYGFVMLSPKDAERRWASILVTWPVPRGLLKFDWRRLGGFSEALRNLPVKFRIRKTLDGREEAVGLRTELTREERRKCIQPRFGFLETVTRRVRVGVVRELDRPESEQVAEGVIERVLPSRDGRGAGFGFIRRPRGESDVFFSVGIFRKAFRRAPEEGEPVKFVVYRNGQGLAVSRFVTGESRQVERRRLGLFSPEDEPNRKIRFLQSEFTERYGREPAVGDLVFFSLESGGRPCFHPSDEQIRFLRVGDKDSSGAKRLHGFVQRFDAQRRFGVAERWRDGKTDLFFENTWHKAYGTGKPKVGQPVAYELGTDDKTGKERIMRFFSVQDCNRANGGSPAGPLGWPEPDRLYCIWQDESGAIQAWRRFRPEVLAEAIACYKDRSLPLIHKLEAVETVLARKYESKNVRPETLEKQRLQILDLRVQRALAERDLFQALHWESRRQRLDPEPGRLARLAVGGATRTRLFVNEVEETALPPLPSWSLLEQRGKQPPEMPPPPAWRLIHEPPAGDSSPPPAAPSALMTVKKTEIRMPFEPAAVRYAIEFDET